MNTRHGQPESLRDIARRLVREHLAKREANVMVGLLEATERNRLINDVRSFEMSLTEVDHKFLKVLRIKP